MYAFVRARLAALARRALSPLSAVACALAIAAGCDSRGDPLPPCSENAQRCVDDDLLQVCEAGAWRTLEKCSEHRPIPDVCAENAEAGTARCEPALLDGDRERP